ncbi:pif-4 [Palpita vitrealis nucleopolyhedrovirus]|uniref:Pif-4 n=1 Tax=Palpita vitrealis nucleopolyhedrovirus TaxID=2951960 RepID=A0AAE9LNJ7_9ABAC|nr:pif-4 [Palpita vitrealis nucleopolyhedrovirus]
MLSIMLMILLLLLILIYFFISFKNHHPFLHRIERLLQDFNNTLVFGAYVQIYDLSTPVSTERLFIIAPENVVLYNFNQTLYYYLDSSNVFCPNEFSVTTFTRSTINAINNTGIYATACTPINSLTLIEHFTSLKNNVPDDLLVLDAAEQIQFTILDIINYLIYFGYVDLG